jgi:putative methyltransferase (TIGR04325 family)
VLRRAINALIFRTTGLRLVDPRKWTISSKVVEQPPPIPLYGYFGDYASFEAAQADCQGYDTASIGEAIAQSRQRSIENAKSEIDERIIEVVAAFGIVIARLDKPTISVLDYGGGSGYYCDILSHFFPSIKIAWTVVETASVTKACSNISHIRWLTDLPNEQFDIALLAGVLQVIPNPYEVLAKCGSVADWIILQKAPTTEPERICRQVVPRHIYEASYPHVFLGQAHLIEALKALGTIEMAWIVEKERDSYLPIQATSRGYLVKSQIPRMR